MATRRDFLRALGIGAGTMVAAPVLQFVPAPKTWIVWLPERNIMARIRITGEMMVAGGEEAFVRACQKEMGRLVGDLQRHEEKLWLAI